MAGPFFWDGYIEAPTGPTNYKWFLVLNPPNVQPIFGLNDLEPSPLETLSSGNGTARS